MWQAIILAGVLVLIGLWAWRLRSARRRRLDQRSDFDKLIGKPAAPVRHAPAGLTKECRWAKDHFRNDPLQARWVCATCNAETFIAPGASPDTCMRPDSRLRDRK